MEVETCTVRSYDGATIRYLHLGQGPAVIVLPGALAVAADYLVFARGLAAHFTVAIVERRGRGGSSPQDADYSIRKECEDVLAVQAATGASLLVGHSFGGLVALEVARDSRTFSKIAVYEPGVSIDGSIPTAWMPRYRQRLAANDTTGAFVEFLVGVGPPYLRLLPRWYLRLLLPLIMKAHERSKILGLLHENLREHEEVARLNNSYQTYHDVSAHVLLMWGGKTRSAADAATIERLKAVLPHVDTQIFHSLDHFGIDKGAPREVAEAVRAYLLKDTPGEGGSP